MNSEREIDLFVTANEVCANHPGALGVIARLRESCSDEVLIEVLRVCSEMQLKGVALDIAFRKVANAELVTFVTYLGSPQVLIPKIESVAKRLAPKIIGTLNGNAKSYQIR